MSRQWASLVVSDWWSYHNNVTWQARTTHVTSHCSWTCLRRVVKVIRTLPRSQKLVHVFRLINSTVYELDPNPIQSLDAQVKLICTSCCCRKIATAFWEQCSVSVRLSRVYLRLKHSDAGQWALEPRVSFTHEWLSYIILTHLLLYQKCFTHLYTYFCWFTAILYRCIVSKRIICWNNWAWKV